MENTRTARQEQVERTIERRPLGAFICGVFAVALLAFLGFGLYDMGDTYGNVTEGGLGMLAVILGLIAASFGAGSVYYATGKSSKAATVGFVVVLVAAAAVYGIVWLII